MRIICLIVLLVCMPVHLYAANISGFGADDKSEYFVPRPREPVDEKAVQEQLQKQKLFQESMAKLPEKADSRWMLWGGVGILALVVGVIALGGSSGGGAGGSTGGSGTGTTSVTGAW